MNKNYNLKLDLQFRCNNSTMKFNQFDNNTSDFFIKISNGGKSFDIEKAIVVLATIKPSGKVSSQFVEVENGLVYADLKPSMKDEIGTYTAKAMLILENERVVTDVISYEVEEDKIFSLLNDTVGISEEFTLLTDMLNRLSTIEVTEEQRVVNEAERILSEENRKIEEAKRVEAELIRVNEEADRAKYDATRESNENVRKQNESIRLANEVNRKEEELKRVEEENKRKLAEEERNANYNFMTEDEERRRSEANAHKEAEVLRVQAETDRVNEEAKRRNTEQARVSAENTRVNNENTREASEVARKNNETQRVEAETQRQNRYNSFIVDAEANANNFENYTNTAKVKEEERKANELDRKSQEVQRISNENERISNENSRKANEEAREKNETSRQYVFENKVDEVDKKIVELNTTKENFISSINTKVDNKISEIDKSKTDMTTTVSNKVNEVETRFNALTSKQQQDAEVIDARDGETSLKARLDRDIEKAKQVYVNVEGSHISTDSSVGYAKDVEILGNTIQSASNLADIRSVGDTIEGQELYEIPVLCSGKNLLTNKLEDFIDETSYKKITINLEIGKDYILSTNCPIDNGSANLFIGGVITNTNGCWNNAPRKVVGNRNIDIYIKKSFVSGTFEDFFNGRYYIQLEEGTQATPYEPYQEDKLTILSPVQLEKVGDIADRIIEKDGVWGVEKNVEKIMLNKNTLPSYIPFLEKDRVVGYTVFPMSFGDVGLTVGEVADSQPLICNKLNWVSSGYFSKIEGKWICINARQYLVLQIPNSELNSFDRNGLLDWIANNNLEIYVPTNNPQFIPLPHDQQIKLRTFASRTNISFLTEIEGTIKAQVPKSLGATVNTHTEQINNLNKELDRVKKLEETTVSTVTTESDFTTVEATSNGYFEDVKLEGKTLVNLVKNGNIPKILGVSSATPAKFLYNRPLELNKVYTLIAKASNINETGDNRPTISYNSGKNGSGMRLNNGINTTVFENKISITDSNEMWVFYTSSSSITSTDPQIDYIYILEGDHTQNPPSYFEGLKSVGQSATTSEDGVDEIVVSSVKDVIQFEQGTLANANGEPVDNANRIRSVDFIDGKYFELGNVDLEKFNTIFMGYDENKKHLYSGSWGKTTKPPIEYPFVKVALKINDSTPIAPDVFKSPIYVVNKNVDKKPLLYYNNETQSWEKPILREWDSIEKHADGKYYYHQRSGEVVLNGSESWGWTHVPGSDSENVMSFNTRLVVNSNIDNYQSLSDKFNYIRGFGTGADFENFFHANSSYVQFRIFKSKLSTQDVQGFKQWLQANNVTVVYQLVQEKVYECTNIDLITYNGETNYIVESGAIVPRTTLKVHNNISNVVSLLQKKVSLLESNVKASQEVQDMMILETDMRMLDIELALMEFIPMTLNLGGSNMLRSATYFNFLKNHIINETYEKEYLENVMNKYLATGRINQDEYNELYKMLYPPVYDIELPMEY